MNSLYRIESYSELLKDIDNCIFIDVRSEKEYEEETIPGSINIPILCNEEREDVGTVYKQKSTEIAKEVGIKYISKRLPEIFSRIQNLYNENKGKKIVVFCARGGMRSGSIHALMNSLGIHIYKLQGGYKAYRQCLKAELIKEFQNIELVTLYGNTGIGKTDMLKELKNKGYDVLDLEGAANHRGSLLGGVGLGRCNSQKMFESLVYEQIKNRKSNLVFTEGESRRICKIIMPDEIWNKILKSRNIYITADLDFRAERLVKEYTDFENANLKINKALDNMKKYINEERIEKYKELVNNNEFKEVAKDLMIKYYDPMYMGASKKRDFLDKIHISSIEEAVAKLIDIYNNLKENSTLEIINGSEFLNDEFIQTTYKG